jgi:hypothetical protein
MRHREFSLEGMVDYTSSHASAPRLDTTIHISAGKGYSEKLEGYIRLHIQKKPRWLPRRAWEAVLRRLIVVESFGPFATTHRDLHRTEIAKVAP